jgi:4-hydroxybenzoate polyprenyltransferase
MDTPPQPAGDAPRPRHTERTTGETPAGPRRWWIYQKERFPFVAHAPLIACFSFCAISYSAHLRGAAIPAPDGFLAAFFTCLISFLHLRLADEFKDFEEDSRWRPYRAVPRGLVRLPELRNVWIATGVLQVVMAVWLDWRLTGTLLATWLYLGLMTREFFAREWLKARPVVYLVSHMFIMPLVDFYATSCDWIPAGNGMPRGLFWFLVVSFWNGVTLELGRKLRAPEDEEPGVETYTKLWGNRIAVGAWWGAMLLCAGAAVAAARHTGTAGLASLIYLPLVVAAGFAGCGFCRRPGSRKARLFEAVSGAWTMVLYLSLGALPFLVRRLS